MALALIVLAGCGAASDGGPPDASSSPSDAGGGNGPDAGVDGGVDGGKDGGDARDAGVFCRPCIQMSDCGPPNLCLGELGHCGLDCSNGESCPAGSTCEAFSNGKGPQLRQCAPTVAACGDLSTLPALSCTDGWSSYASTFFADCNACHVGVYGTEVDVRSNTEGVRWAIDFGGMPRDRQLSATERTRILTWLGCGSAAPPTGLR